MPRRLPVLLLCAAVHAAASGADATAGETPAPRPAPPADPFSIWDGVTQLYPKPHAESKSHAEFAKSAELNLDLESVDTGGQLEFVDNPAIPSLSLIGEFVLPDDTPEGLSGIAWRGGLPGFNGLWDDLYAFVEDSGGRLHSATLSIDLRTGEITNAVVSPAGAIPGAADLEGVAAGCIASVPMLFASDERGPAIFAKPAFDTSCPDWAVLPLPEPLRHCRPNKALESLALSADGRILWTANEEALPEDGPVSSTGSGSRIRLYALDVSGLVSTGTDSAASATAGATENPSPPPWWFYDLDPPPGVSFRPLPDPFNGLSDLCALPDGRLLALERAYGFVERPENETSPGSLITISIYLIDPLHAEPAAFDPHAEAAEFAEAGGAGVPPAVVSHAEFAEAASSAARTAAAARPAVLAKTLVWRGLTGRANYEGMTLGPELADGSRALLLVSDGDVTRKGAFAFPWAKRLLALRLKP